MWDGCLVKAAQDKLISIQRMFLFQLSRGYIIISSDSLHAITGISAITLIILYEYNLNQITHINKNLIAELDFPNTLIQQKTPS